MPQRPPTDMQLRRGKQQRDRRYNAERRLVCGPDPRSTARWQRLRTLVLSEQPLCADPYGTHREQRRVEPATEVDHIISLRTQPALAFERSNLQGLCTVCHGRKSQEERCGLVYGAGETPPLHAKNLTMTEI